MPTYSKKQSEPFSVLIVGCGMIAGGYDEPQGDSVKTHAKAYLRHGGFRLVGCVDPDLERAQAFAARWHVDAAFQSLEAAAVTRYDVVSICSPPAAHAGQLRTLLDWDVRLVFCEKPLTHEIALSRSLVDAYRRRRRLLCVNYQRRWEPDVRRLKSEITDGRWGRLLTAHGIYTKGIHANGSHLIDLLHTLVGPVEPVSISERRFDYMDSDPTLAGSLRTAQQRPVVLSIGDCRCFTVFELDLLFEQGRVTFGDSGWTLCERRIIDDSRYRGYRILEPPVIRQSAMGRAISAAVANLYDCLVDGVELASTGDTALASQETCHRLQELAENIPWENGA